MHVPGPYRTPRQIDGATFRAYRCLNPDCSRLFMTEERAINRSRAEALEEKMLPSPESTPETPTSLSTLEQEEIEELMRTGLPIASSAMMPEDLD